MVSEALAGVLAQSREDFNERFARARHLYPKLAPEVFSAHLSQVLSPLAESLAAVSRAQLPYAVSVLYDLSLELVGRELLGPASKAPFVKEAWDSLLPCAARLLLDHPRRVAGEITNALYNLSSMPDMRPDLWISLMREAVKSAATADELSVCGQIAAWRAGAAHYRSAVFKLCRGFRPELLLPLFGFSKDAETRMPELLQLMEADRWLTPEAAERRLLRGHVPERVLRVVARAGGFSGFGGPFVEPPIVGLSLDGQLICESRGERRALFADWCGVSFQNVDEPFASTTSPALFKVDANGTASLNGLTGRFELLVEPNSCASDGVSAVVTSRLSHKIVILAACDGD